MADFYWIGVKRLEIATQPLNPGDEPVWIHVPSIEQCQVRATVQEVKVYGDEQLQYNFVHSPEMQLNVKLTKFSGAAAALISGNAEISSAGSRSQYFMTQKDMTPPILLARATLPARDDSTSVATELRLIFFRTQFRPVWDNVGGERSKGTELNWVADVLASTKDERGNPLPAGTEYAHARWDFLS